MRLIWLVTVVVVVVDDDDDDVVDSKLLCSADGAGKKTASNVELFVPKSATARTNRGSWATDTVSGLQLWSWWTYGLGGGDDGGGHCVDATDAAVVSDVFKTEKAVCVCGPLFRMKSCYHHCN